MKPRNLIHILIGIVCIGLLPKVQAVNPPPDGGYPGGNTAEGQAALLSLTTGGFNTAVGYFSLLANTTGSFNTAVGAGALDLNTENNNTATGAAALLFNTTGTGNTANGTAALEFNETGSFNTATGAFALFQNTGSDNAAIGTGALQFNTTGSGNIALGNGAGSGIGTADSVICIGTFGANVSNSCYIGNIRGVTPANADAVPVLIDSAGQLGTTSSSRRYKKEIKPMNQTSEAILGLKPVTFHYKSDKTNTPQFGLIAEEVAKVNSELVVRDKNGEIYTVRYEAVNAMLLNEFLKEHRNVEAQHSKIEKQQAMIAQLKSGATKQEARISQLNKDMKILTAQLEEQAAQIQKVSAQMEASRPPAKVIVNNQ